MSRAALVIGLVILLAGCAAPSSEEPFVSWRVSGREPGLFDWLNASDAPAVLRIGVSGPPDPLDAPNLRDALGRYRVSLVSRDLPDGTHLEWRAGGFGDEGGEVVFVRALANATERAVADAVARFVSQLTLLPLDEARSTGQAAAASWRANLTPRETIIHDPTMGTVGIVGTPESEGHARFPAPARLAEAFAQLGGRNVTVEPIDREGSRPTTQRTVHVDGWAFHLGLPLMELSLDSFEPGGLLLHVDAHDRFEGNMPLTHFRAPAEIAAHVDELLASHGLAEVPHANWSYELS